MSAREKPFRVFYFSSNLDHVLFGKANNERWKKVGDASKFSNAFYNEPLKMASYFLNHPGAAPVKNFNDYYDSWELLSEDSYSLKMRTNINILVDDLLKRAKMKSLPENDVWL